MKLRLVLFLLLTGLSLAPWLAGDPAQAAAPTAPAVPPVTISRSAEHRVTSTAVGDDYVIQVRLPASYEKTTANYPVLCVLDADMLFEIAAGTADLLAWRREIPELIVIGISYGGSRKDWWAKRSRDMTPTPDRSKVWGDWPLAGGAAKFQDFLAQELFPLIESHYRVRVDDRTLVGLSFGGLFGTYTLFTKPELFQRYVIMGPSVIWDEKRMWEYEARFRAQHTALPAIVFTAVGDRDDAPTNIAPWEEFNRLIEGRRYEGLRWTSHVFPDETHISVYPGAITRGLKVVFAKPTSPPFPFAEATIGQLQEQIGQGKLTARELTAGYLRRIAEIDKSGPMLNAVIELNPDALDIATQLDAERQAGKVRGPLHGIPVLIKDNIATADRMETTAGSLALVGAKPLRDAPLVTRLREAGAVILGKTNPSEWAYFRSSVAMSGWSGRGGQTHNPYALDRNPSGSSSGSAAAVAANLCVVAVGTETDGSIVSPSAHCGIVGVKPTVGLVSRTGIIPISISQDTAGPMARTVRDAAILLGVLAGSDTHDTAMQNRPADLPSDFAAAMKPGALKGARIGILHGPYGLQARMEGVLGKAVAAIRAAGGEVVDLGELPSLSQLTEPESVVLLYEFKDGINAWFASLGPTAPVKSLAELIAFNETHRTQEMRFFGQDLFIRAQAKGPLTEPAYLDARAACLRISRVDGIDALMEKHKLDAIVSLTSGPAWLTDPVNGDFLCGESSTLAAVAGYPSVTVPVAQVSGLPVGVSFFGRAWSEAKLLSLAADFEGRTHARHEPPFLPTVAIDRDAP